MIILGKKSVIHGPRRHVNSVPPPTNRNLYDANVLRLRLRDDRLNTCTPSRYSVGQKAQIVTLLKANEKEHATVKVYLNLLIKFILALSSWKDFPQFVNFHVYNDIYFVSKRQVFYS